MSVLDGMYFFLQPNTCDTLMFFGADMWNFGSMIGVGNFGGLYLGTTISRR
jgi:hypothetical protein